MCLPTWELCQCAKPPQGRDNALGAEELPPFYCSPKAGGWTAESQGLQMQSTKTAAENQGVCCQGQLEHQTAGKWSLDKVSHTLWALGTPPVPGTLCLWWFNFVICPIDTQKCIFKSKHHFFSDEMNRLVWPCSSGPFAMTEFGVSALGDQVSRQAGDSQTAPSAPLSEAAPPAKWPSPSTNKIMLSVCVYG